MQTTRCLLLVAAILPAIATPVSGQMAVYQPLGTWVDPQRAAFAAWDLVRQMRTSHLRQSAADSSRPRSAGLRPRYLELLQDSLLRKFTTKVRSDALARQYILRLAGSRTGRNVLTGAMAEAMFADRNPEESYVKRANAPQHDFTRARPGGGRINTQVKFHESGNPAQYAADMKKDWRATKFAVPDDHVSSLKSYLTERYYRLRAIGDVDGANGVARNIGRVRGIGASSTDIQSAVRGAARYVSRQRYTAYTSFGAAIALSLGPTMWDWSRGDIAANQALYRSTRSLSLIGVAVGTDTLLRFVGQGALRGTLRGNLIIGTALSVTEITWLLYEHGWRQALHRASFYEDVGGSLTALAFGIPASVAVIAWVPGPGWIVGGAAVVVGAVAGTVGYLGGRSATFMVLDIVKPEMLQEAERQQLAAVRKRIRDAMLDAQTCPCISK